MKIGTDFSGIGSPEMALKLLNIEHDQVFACDIDKYARKSYEAIHGTPQTFYEDITKRDHSDIPQLDLYVAGFPCQSFSMAGKRKGFDNVRTCTRPSNLSIVLNLISRSKSAGNTFCIVSCCSKTARGSFLSRIFQ